MYKENLSLPDFILQEPVLSSIYSSQGQELDGISEAISELEKQGFIDTATWGLDSWESFLGITTELQADINYRRTSIKTKLMGTGTVTQVMLENIAEGFSNGAVEIHENPTVYNFEVKFTGTIGVPVNISAIKAAIDQIKPAHLAVSYIYIYLSWGQTKTQTWNTLKSKTWDDLMNGR